jgi:hypothetical protein
METNGDQTTNLTRFTVAQAADVLGLSAEAVRMRIKRGTLAHVKEENTVYVLLDPSSLETDPTPQRPQKRLYRPRRSRVGPFYAVTLPSKSSTSAGPGSTRRLLQTSSLRSNWVPRSLSG